jgi:hypothetical protein
MQGLQVVRIHNSLISLHLVCQHLVTWANKALGITSNQSNEHHDVNPKYNYYEGSNTMINA